MMAHPTSKSLTLAKRCTGSMQVKRRFLEKVPKLSLFNRRISSSYIKQSSERPHSRPSDPAQRRSQKASCARFFALGATLTGAAWAFSSSLGDDACNEQQSMSSTLREVQAKPPTLNMDSTTIREAYKELEVILGEQNVTSSEHDVKAHAGSEFSSYSNMNGERSFAIAYPATTEEVSKIMAMCHSRRIPVTAYSGGTSLEGHLVPTHGGICVDFSRMNHIIKIHEKDLDVVVQPGVGWEDLDEELSMHGLFFPPDPGPGAKIGGMVGTGCSGTNAYRYGTMRDWVLSLTVVLADGTVIKTRQRPRKSSAGYDLTRLFIGSEGTLGLVTEATLKVTGRPKNTSVAVASFPSLYAAADCVSRLVSSNVQISGMELLDDSAMRFVNNSGATGQTWAELPSLFFKFSGTETEVQSQIALVKAAAERSSSQSFDFALSEQEAMQLWSARKEALWSILAAKKRPSDHVWTTDVAVPISRLCEIIQETKDDMAKHGLDGGIVGHVGDGNYHAMILFGEEQRPIAQKVISSMVHRAIEMEGTASGEHGIGLIKRAYLPRELGQPAVDTMRMIKMALDPQCILNRNKIFSLGVQN